MAAVRARLRQQDRGQCTWHARSTDSGVRRPQMADCEHFAQNPLEAPCCRTRRRRRARNRLREREAVPRRQAVSIVAPSTRAPPASATALPRRTPGDGPQRPRAAKPSRGHAPQPGHRPAQPPVAAHPDRPRPQGAGLRPPAPFLLSAVGAQFSEWFRTRLSPLLRSKAGQVKLWGLPKNVSLPKTLKNASLEIFRIQIKFHHHCTGTCR